MDELRAYTTQMTQKLTKLDSGKASIRTEPKLPLKNAFERNFSAFVKVYFSSPKQANRINYAIMILMQLTELKSETQKCQNDHRGVLAQTNLISHYIDGMFE
jgi:hypothetical protein